jgi:hypothetical protein
MFTLRQRLTPSKQLNLPKRRRIPCLPRVNMPSTSTNTQSAPEVQTAVQKESTTAESTSESTPAVNGNTNTTNDTGTGEGTTSAAATVKTESENKEAPPPVEVSLIQGVCLIPGWIQKVRGRVYTPEKPKSFNKLWDAEEQRRLEELLLIYPDETVAAHRWKKIADALGNRTPKQVASRTQKYFIKLAKKGKPVPGKMPNLEVITHMIHHPFIHILAVLYQ